MPPTCCVMSRERMSLFSSWTTKAGVSAVALPGCAALRMCAHLELQCQNGLCREFDVFQRKGGMKRDRQGG